MSRWLFLLALPMIGSPALARDSLGIFADWGAFRDPDLKRCYAIAMPSKPSDERETRPFASVGSWPDRKVRGQFHIRLSRAVNKAANVRLVVGTKRFNLAGGGTDAWAKDQPMDAAIITAMRNASTMSVSTQDRAGKRFTDRYSLDGAATAMDAATIGCASV